MKVIDLLNRIANGEDVPSPIYHNGLYYDFEDGDYFNQENISWLFNDNDINTILNDTVEILKEEKKIPEKINIKFWSDEEYTPEQRINVCMTYIDEIIDYLDYLKSKGE